MVSIYTSSTPYEAKGRATQRRINVELIYDGSIGSIGNNEGIYFDLYNFGSAGYGRIPNIKAGDILSILNVDIAGTLRDKVREWPNMMYIEMELDKIRSNQRAAAYRATPSTLPTLTGTMGNQNTTQIYDKLIYRELVELPVRDYPTFWHQTRFSVNEDPTATGFIIEDHGAGNDTLQLLLRVRENQFVRAESGDFSPSINNFVLKIEFLITSPL